MGNRPGYFDRWLGSRTWKGPKERRKPYYGAAAFDWWCRPHGLCWWSFGERYHKHRRQMPLEEDVQFIKEESLRDQAATCDFCGREISKGIEFIRSYSTDGRAILLWDTCLQCQELINHFDMFFHDDILDDHEFMETVKEELKARGVDVFSLDADAWELVDMLNDYIEKEGQ